MRYVLQATTAFLVTLVLLLTSPLCTSSSDIDKKALSRIFHPPLGLPMPPVPDNNPATIAKIHLGRKLFLDRRLSSNGTLSCAMCHVPEQGFTVNEIRTAVGNQGKSLRRNSPTLLNVAFGGPFFHDGREPDLDFQPFDVFLNPDEMAAPSLGALVHEVRGLADYNALFQEAFREPATVENIGQSIGTYLRTLVSGNSPYDRWRFQGDEKAMSESSKRGYRLFTGPAGCSNCHLVGEENSLFTDHSFHDTGLGWYNSTTASKSREPVAVEIAPGRVTHIDRSAVDSVGDPFANDLGRYEVTGHPSDRWRFKTPSLRNVAVTAPYMHDGSFSTLREVVEFYNRGAHPHPGLDPRIRPLDFQEEQIAEIVEFLENLTGDNLEELVRDARSEPVGNPNLESMAANRKLMAITVDDLPSSHPLTPPDLHRLHQSLLAAFEAHQAPAIGFVNASKLEEDGQEKRKILAEWIEAGHALGNHGYAHLDLHRVGVDAFIEDISAGHPILEEIYGHQDDFPRYFRHPYLHTGRSEEDRAAVTGFLKKWGYRVAPVTIDNSEWIYARAYENSAADGDSELMRKLGEDYVAYMMDKVAFFENQTEQLFGRSIPQVLLIHANRLNGDWLQELLASLEQKGHEFISLPEALADHAYGSEDRYFGPAGLTWLHRWALTRDVEKSFFEGEPRVPEWVLKAAGVESE